MKRGGPLKRTPLARVGRKKRSKAGPRALVIELVHRRDCRCRFWFYVQAAGLKWRMIINTEACAGTLDVHEIVPRSVWPDGDLDITNCVLLCRYHHIWIDSNRDLAEAIGLYRRTKP